MIFHQPRFPWNFRGFPLLFTTIWGEFTRVFGRYNLTRRYQVEPFAPFRAPGCWLRHHRWMTWKIYVQPKKNTFLCHQNASWVVWLVRSKVCWNNGMFHGNEPNVGRYALKCLGMLKKYTLIGSHESISPCRFFGTFESMSFLFPCWWEMDKIPGRRVLGTFVTRLLFW